MTATAEAIRDRVLTLIESLTPTSLAGDRFRRYRNEGDGDFRAWATDNPAAAFRRVQARDTGNDPLPEVSNTLVEERSLTLEIVIAYPQNARYGKANSLDRDDAMNQDYLAIDYVIGQIGAGNFSGANNCTPFGCEKAFERGGKIDFLVLTARFKYWRSTT